MKKFWTSKETKYWHSLYVKYYGTRKKHLCPVCGGELRTWREKRKKIFHCSKCRVTKMREARRWRIL